MVQWTISLPTAMVTHVQLVGSVAKGRGTGMMGDEQYMAHPSWGEGGNLAGHVGDSPSELWKVSSVESSPGGIFTSEHTDTLGDAWSPKQPLKHLLRLQRGKLHRKSRPTYTHTPSTPHAEETMTPPDMTVHALVIGQWAGTGISVQAGREKEGHE